MAGEPPQLSWSGSFEVDTLLKGPTGDKINLPSSALQQLLDANTASAAAGVTASSYPTFAGYRENAPQTQHQLPYPLMFRIVNEANKKAVYAGVREFSAEEGRVVLSPFLLRSLGLPSEVDNSHGQEKLPSSISFPRVKITARQLPKGHYVGLSPKHEYASYDPKVLEPLLERELRQGYTTLSTGTTLHVRGGLKEGYEFLVESVKPEGDGICVIDTDLELDLLRVPTATEQEPGDVPWQVTGSNKQAPSEEIDKSSPGGDIGLWKAVEGQVQHDDYVDYELTSWDKSRGLVIEASHPYDPDANAEFFLDIFASPKTPHLRERPRETQHWVARMDPHTPRHPTQLEIQPAALGGDEVESLMIAVYGFRDERLSAIGTRPHRFTLSVKPLLAHGGTGSGPANEAAGEETPADVADKRKCSNCGQWIAKQNYVLHTLRCARNKKCPLCGLVASSDVLREHWHCRDCDDPHAASGDSRVTKEKHDRRMHPAEPFRCTCSADILYPSVTALAHHRVTDCPDKVILCRFCHLEVAQEGDMSDPSVAVETAYTGLAPHERADGARTADCALCGSIVRLRDMVSHLRHHELDKKGRARPEVCRNAACGRTLHGVGPRGAVGPGAVTGGVAVAPGNDLDLCTTCFGPLYVSMYDPEGKALRRRVERRYLTQLMVGCGRAWCSNEWCRTGRVNTGKGAVGQTTSAALPLIRGLVTPEAVADKGTKMHFCVDEPAQRAMVTAEMLAAEGVWDLEWCVAACEKEGGDRDKAREWLANWAPNRYE